MNRAETLQQLAWICRGAGADRSVQVEPSGWAALDALLPGGGWQAGTLVELMPAQTGIGELRLLMPALSRITHDGRHVALIAPPYVPFAPALSQQGVKLERLLIVRAETPGDVLWACEQTLRCRSFGAVLVWPAALQDRHTRRLQLAAEAGRSIAFVYRPPRAAREVSHAAVRMKLDRHASGGLEVEIVKCRGGRSGISLQLTA
ncbi:MAG TPA: translesion DNA synthesis-associated protein ImuA [Steroidobacter sp.]